MEEGGSVGDAWFIGPFLIQEKWALYVISFVISYFVLRIVLKKKTIDSLIMDTLWNGFFTFIITWKFSYALFHPISVIQNPISLLYFTGGDRGMILGVISVLLYFLWKSKRSSFSFHQYMELGILAVLTAIGSYRVFVWLFYLTEHFILLFDALLPFAIVLYLIKSEKWLASVLWFSLGELLFSYFKHESPVILGFSWKQLFYFAVIVICLIFVMRTKMKLSIILKKWVPILLLVGLISWSVYDNVTLNDRKESAPEEQREGKIGIKQGELAPDFTLHTLQGESVTLSDFRGKHVILNFWATWCPPCRAEMPDMQAYYDGHRENDNFVILAVNLTATESNRGNIQPFIDELGLTFPILLDEDSEVANTYEVVGYPTSYFIDDRGMIQYKVVGPMNRDFMRKQVRQMNE